MVSSLAFSIVLTHWGRDKMAAISQTTLSNTFYWMKMLYFRLKFHWSLFLRVQLIISQHWFRLWLGADQATIHYLNQWWLDYRRIYASLNELRKTQFLCHVRSQPLVTFYPVHFFGIKILICRKRRVHVLCTDKCHACLIVFYSDVAWASWLFK